jgi:hypothetical protein
MARTLAIVAPYGMRTQAGLEFRRIKFLYVGRYTVQNRTSQSPFSGNVRLSSVLAGETVPSGIQISETKILPDAVNGSGIGLQIIQVIREKEGFESPVQSFHATCSKCY